jgi:hypothetical protein
LKVSASNFRAVGEAMLAMLEGLSTVMGTIHVLRIGSPTLLATLWEMGPHQFKRVRVLVADGLHYDLADATFESLEESGFALSDSHRWPGGIQSHIMLNACSPTKHGHTCCLLLPAHNEAANVRQCLDSVLSSKWPSSFRWKEWWLLDDASCDATVAVASAWKTHHPDAPPFCIVSSPTRRGKGSNIGSAVTALASRPDPPGIVVVADVDGILEPDALSRLLAPFANSPDVGVVWGLGKPLPVAGAFRASLFQRSLMEARIRATPEGYHAGGSLFAARLTVATRIPWADPTSAEDLQLQWYVEKSGTAAATVPEAVIRLYPPRCLRDFYLQTYRHYAACREGQSRRPSVWFRAPRPVALKPLLATSLSDPGGALSYLVARVGAAFLHRVRPGHWGATWEEARTTKHAASS